MTRSALAITFLSALSACAAGGDPEAEAEAEAAGGGGKADEVGFSLGHYQSYDVEYEAEHQLPVAVFMPPQADTPDSDTGAVDFAYYDGNDYVSARGSFKLYRYGGRDRIRVSDERGNIVVRSDWSRDGSELRLGEYTLHQLPNEPTSTLSCLALEVTGGDFEEGFTVHEYPDVSVDKNDDGTFHVSLGVSGFETGDGDTITLEAGGGMTTVRIVASYGSVFTVRVPDAHPRRGVVELDDQGDIAQIICR